MTPENVFYRIVVPTDFSECAEQAWALAQQLAEAFPAELLLVHVLPVPLEEYGGRGSADATVFTDARQWDEKNLAVAQAKPKGLRARPAARSGDPGEEVIALATDERADLIAIGTHGRGEIDRALLGSVADRVVRLAPCPVLTVREAA